MDSYDPSKFETSIDHVVEMVRNRRETKDGCSLLIGAGCSVTAGIPSAAGFVELIKQRYAAHHAQAEPKNYPRCMAALPSGARRRLIEEKVDDARINWAHIAIAQLMKAGYVDRVLTTNFDPLIVRACALVGESPAVYDFAVSQLLKPEHIPHKAVFHLHGQRTGFILLNTEQEVVEHSQRLGALFKTAGEGKAWIVVGYSGESDRFSRIWPMWQSSTSGCTGSGTVTVIRRHMSVTVCFSLGSLPGTFAATMRTASSSSSHAG